MDFEEYRRRGKEMVDYIADYLENIRERKVFPDVKPGYMGGLLPDSAPVEGEPWESIFADVERVIMPGVTHWQSPHMHAYFPALNSFPSLLGDMLADAVNCLGFTWASSPACTELEIIVMNWLGKMIGLPDAFLHQGTSGSRGGGVVQTTASEATLVCLLAGRTRAIRRFHDRCPGFQDAEINARLVAYCSDQAHSSVEKAALIGLVRMRYIEADDNLAMRGAPLREAIEDDIRQGLVPFWVCATLGTTGACAFDDLEEIGVVCREFNLWLHVDAAYAGSAFICPEYRTWLKGIERADSLAFNPSKWLMIHFDATALWVQDSTALHRTFNVEPLYLQHENSGVSVDFMHWQIPLSRRFRALKIWHGRVPDPRRERDHRAAAEAPEPPRQPALHPHLAEGQVRDPVHGDLDAHHRRGRRARLDRDPARGRRRAGGDEHPDLGARARPAQRNEGEERGLRLEPAAVELAHVPEDRERLLRGDLRRRRVPGQDLRGHPDRAPGVAVDAKAGARHPHVGQAVLAGLAHGRRGADLPGLEHHHHPLGLLRHDGHRRCICRRRWRRHEQPEPQPHPRGRRGGLGRYEAKFMNL